MSDVFTLHTKNEVISIIFFASNTNSILQKYRGKLPISILYNNDFLKIRCLSDLTTFVIKHNYYKNMKFDTIIIFHLTLIKFNSDINLKKIQV